MAAAFPAGRHWHAMTSSPLTPLERALAKQIAARAEAQPVAIGVWVFGSRARGASNEDSDLDIAIEFSSPETSELRDWLEQVRVEAEAPVADQWPGFVNLVGLFADDVDPRLRNRVYLEGLTVWVRYRQSQPASGRTPLQAN